MKKQIKTKLNNTSGLTLIEMLTVVLILLLVSAIVAAGVPAAMRVYNRVVDASNAQVLLSTTKTRLRDEIGTASDIEITGGETPAVPGVVTGNAISYDNSLGISNRIDCCTDTTYDDKPVIFIQEYANHPEAEMRKKFYHPLVSNSASAGNLYATFENVTDNGSGIITFHNVVVKKRKVISGELTDELTEKTDISIRVLSFVE